VTCDPDETGDGETPDIDPAEFPAIIAHLREHDAAAYVAAVVRLLFD